ncbi:hypothetical protein [Actinomadura atramentaria]|uniref:hypothetical protein n=1 Tax=Actinomadura atramentaria TaxID=1990 RepID=UPI00035F8D05|nr:hypothetical protein [Actinomadura atramentaria]
MAPPPQFSMYSPTPPDDGDDGGGAPVPVLTAADDPGFAASIRTRTLLGQWRFTAVALMVAPVLILVVSPLIVREGPSLLAGSLAWVPWTPPVLAALAAALVGPRLPRPLPPGLAPARAARLATLQARQATLVRFALTEGVILCGLPLAMIAREELVFVLAFVLGYPQLVWQILPTTAAVERLRRRLEAGDAESYLWSGLLAPVPRPSDEDADEDAGDDAE